MATHLLVGNPTAQSGKNQERITQAIHQFSARGISVELLPTEPAGRTIGSVRAKLDTGGYRVVIAMGGDGTFREVASGLFTSKRREDVAMGMLPTGTANDQGKSFGLEATPDALARNVEVIANGKETRLDVCVYRGADDPRALDAAEPAYFFDSAGWGLSARVLQRRNEDRRLVESLGPLKELYRDHAVYAGAFLTTFLESYVVPDKLVARGALDGQPFLLDGLTDLIVKNTRVYAGGWIFDRTSRSDDGAVELVPFRGKRDWVSKAIVDIQGNPITEELLNELGVEHSHPIRARRIELELVPPAGGAPLATQLDGEEWPAKPFVRVEVVARGLRLIVPTPP
jgi:diacylglycerol kinase family enzyme